jgi:acetylornithine/succinyldiaminopimelate/putrescine aminotransferase
MQKLIRTELEGEMICLRAHDKSQQNKKGSEFFEFACTYSVRAKGRVHIHLLAHLATIYKCAWYSTPVPEGRIRTERATNFLQESRPESENVFKLTRNSGKN